MFFPLKATICVRNIL